MKGSWKRKGKKVDAYVPQITYVLGRGLLDPAHLPILFFIWNMEALYLYSRSIQNETQ